MPENVVGRGTNRIGNQRTKKRNPSKAPILLIFGILAHVLLCVETVLWAGREEWRDLTPERNPLSASRNHKCLQRFYLFLIYSLIYSKELTSFRVQKKHQKQYKILRCIQHTSAWLVWSQQYFDTMIHMALFCAPETGIRMYPDLRSELCTRELLVSKLPNSSLSTLLLSWIHSKLFLTNTENIAISWSVLIVWITFIIYNTVHIYDIIYMY